MLTGLKALLWEKANRLGDEVLAAAADVHRQLITELGLVVTLAVYLTAATIAVLLIWRMVKFSFDIVRCVAIPAVAVALVSAWLLPFSFLHILPVATAIFAVLLLLRG